MSKRGQLRNRLTAKELRFLQLVAEGKTHTDAYLESGHKAATRELAGKYAYVLMKRCEAKVDREEIFRMAGLSDMEVAHNLQDLMTHKDPHVRARILAVITKCKGWQKEVLDVPEGVAIAIVRKGTKVEPENVKDPTTELGKQAPKAITIKD
jgi:hypothetical protein